MQPLLTLKVPCRTISPSLEKARDYARIKCLLRHNVTPCLGHDVHADEESILQCLRLAKAANRRLHITHMYNASAFHHRQVSLCNFGLLNSLPNLPKYKDIELPTIEIIGDLVHVHPLALKLAIEMRGGTFCYDNARFFSSCLLL